MRILIDIPVFSSPTTALGHANGAVEVERLPKEREAFAWPSSFVGTRSSYFSQEQSLVFSVTERAAECFVMLCGIVCDSVADARDFAAYLEQELGLVFDKYDHRESGHDA